MPRISLGVNKRDQEILIVVNKYMLLQDWSLKDLSRVTCIPKSTLSKALKDMSYLKIYQLRLIYDALRVPKDERAGL